MNFQEFQKEFDVIQSLRSMQNSIESSIMQLEEEFRNLQQPTPLKSDKLYPSGKSAVQGPHTFANAPHWDQVLSLLSSNEEDSVYALIRVAQRLLDEKATKKSLNEKATKAYVDSLFDRVFSGVKDNIDQCTIQSKSELVERVAETRQKITDIRKFMQEGINDIQHRIKALNQTESMNESIIGNIDDDDDQDRKVQAFTVHPNRKF